MNLKGYANSCATISLISDAVLSEKILKSLSVYKGNVKDDNGNSVNILGDIAVLMEVNSSLICEKILVFKRTGASAHDLLIVMYILRFAELSFVKKESVLIM